MERQEHRFIVHVWLEKDGWPAAQWRGEVDHVGTGRRFYFSSLTDLMDFMRLRMTEAPPSQPASKNMK